MHKKISFTLSIKSTFPNISIAIPSIPITIWFGNFKIFTKTYSTLMTGRSVKSKFIQKKSEMPKTLYLISSQRFPLKQSPYRRSRSKTNNQDVSQPKSNCTVLVPRRSSPFATAISLISNSILRINSSTKPTWKLPPEKETINYKSPVVRAEAKTARY